MPKGEQLMAMFENSIIRWNKVIIGKNVYIGAGCTIGGPPEHAYVNPNNPEEYGIVEIADNVRIYDSVNINCGLKEGKTVIGEGTTIMAQSHIGHDCRIGKNCRISSGSVLGGHTVVKDNANIGINATTHQFTVVGEGTIVGAGCFAKGVLDDWSKYHTGKAATNQGLNQHLLDRMGIQPNQKEGFNH